MLFKVVFKSMVALMIATLCNLLGLEANAAAPISTYSRQVDISGNIFSFSMPENFGKDMPAANMVEKLDISDTKKFDNPEYGNIIRRWWDIKAPGFFGKQLGTVMMDISVQKVPENKQKLIHNKPYDITNRLDFLLMMDDVLRHRYRELQSASKANGDFPHKYQIDFCYMIGSKLESSYRDYIYNRQRWTGYTVTAPNDQLIVGLFTPINNEFFLELIFTYSPNKNIIPREFLGVAYQTTDIIENSLLLKYKNNTTRKLVEEDWVNITNDEVLANNYDQILIPLFGPDIYHRIAEDKKRALELQKELEKPLDNE